MAANQLYYGDNLDILRRYVADETVDLVYLDPPFNSNASYNVLFAEKNGTESSAQIQAFGDTWHWNQTAEAAYQELVETGPERVAQAMQAFRTFLGTSDMMAYLAMMAPRLAELHRTLKPTGSIYLHCDPTASHYLKMLLDAVFGPVNFTNEVIWQRTSAHSDARQGAQHFGRMHDVLLFYKRSAEVTWNPQHVQHSHAYTKSHYPYIEEGTGRRFGLWDITGPGGAAKGNPYYEIFGVSRYWRYSEENMRAKIREGRVIQRRPGVLPREKRYLDESAGVPVGSIWSDIPPINSQARERLGYPTQKPEALLERIIQASSNEGDLVLDPFCGCGTTIAVAERLGRRWVGIDITHLAIGLMKHRLEVAFEGTAEYDVIGEPVSLAGARQLAEEDPFQFQFWATGLVGARPVDQKKGADQGIDGRIRFHDERTSGKTKQIILQVKAGKTGSKHVRDLRGVIEREKAEIGVLITMQQPTQPMIAEAATAGFYESPGWHKKYPRLQLLTIKQLLDGTRIDYPPASQVNITLKRAPKSRRKQPKRTQREVEWNPPTPDA